mgnify:CR=1 FL=1
MSFIIIPIVAILPEPQSTNETTWRIALWKLIFLIWEYLLYSYFSYLTSYLKIFRVYQYVADIPEYSDCNN